MADDPAPAPKTTLSPRFLVTFNKCLTKEKPDYLARLAFTRFSVRMTMVSCRYFIRGETACKKVTWTDSGELELRGCSAITRLGKKARTYVVIVDGVRRQADVLDVPSQLRQHLQKRPKKKRNVICWRKKQASRPMEPWRRPSRSAA